MLSGPGPMVFSRATAMTFAAFFAISCYNVIEISISIFDYFKRHNSLYFWSMLIATLGILMHSLGEFLRLNGLAPNLPMSVVTLLGWYTMVTGQAIVLYSRLHLVVHDKRKIRWVLIMIITDACIFHIPVTVLFVGTNTANPTHFATGFNFFENVQLTGFCIQETVISGLYIWETARFLRPILRFRSPSERKIIRHLILINILIIILDITILLTQYTNHFYIQHTYKPVVYSIKLKMEFKILNQLLTVVNGGNCDASRLGKSAKGNLHSFSTDGTLQCKATNTIHSVSSGKTEGHGTKLHGPKCIHPTAVLPVNSHLDDFGSGDTSDRLKT
jgi:hypothetical protein